MKRKKLLSLILSFTLVTQFFLGTISTKWVKAVEQNSSTSTAITNSQTIIFVDGSQSTDAAQNRYKTITEAVAAAPVVNDESSRVIISIADGTYREQVIVNKPYITFKSASGDASKVILTWYYGIGYVYNNIGTDGLYNSNVDWSAESTWTGLTKYKAGDVVSKITYYDKTGVLHTDEPVKEGMLGKPNGWGCATRLYKEAKYFNAENITFESSFNYYVTQEEIDAGVKPEPQNTPKPDRASLGKGSVEVEKSNYVERSAALYTDSDNTIFRNCVITSKQDTLFTGSGRLLFDNCTIQGGTDYIFGGATAVFNKCNLVYAGVSDDGKSGTTTAASHKPAVQYGYLFWNCTIDYRLKDKTPAQGSLGRPWSDPLGAQVTYYNTTIKKVNGVQLVNDAGWSDMGTKVHEARFYEYGSVDENGNAIDTSKRPKNSLAPMGIVLDKWQILEFNPRNYLKGSDGWDPMDYAKNYPEIDIVLNSTSINTSGTGDTISLPSAPAGYEFSWASDSKYAVVSEDKASITVVRPAYGEPAINATVTLYAKNSSTGFGDKKTIAFQIQPQATTENTFSINGTVGMKSAATSDVNVQILFKQSGVTIKNQTCTIPAGQTSIQYNAQYLPAGSYDVIVEAPNGYKLISDVTATVSGNKGDTKTIDINIGKLTTYTVKTTDFAETWATSVATAEATGFAMDKYTVTGSETAKLGETGNVVYKLTKDPDAIIPANVGGSWDLMAAVKANGNSLDNADTIQFSYDFLMESTSYLPSNYSYFDLATSTTNAGAGVADNTRLLRWGVYKGWTQFNMFGANNVRVNGDKTQFNTNDNMANKWYHIVANIDLKKKVITTTLYNRDANTILNKKAFNIAVPDSTGNNPAYPTAADLTKALYFNVYMDSSNTTNKMEYYFDNLELQYNDYAVQAPVAPINVAVEGGDKNATITWDTVADAKSYTVKQSSSAEGPFTEIQTDITETDGKLKAQISNLENNKTYYFLVTASNSIGESPSSAVVSATPKAADTAQKIKPSDFVGADIGDTGLKGSTTFDDDTNTFTITGAGKGISKNATGPDTMQFAGVKLSGDFTISAKVTALGDYNNYPTYATMGITIRSSYDPASFHVTQGQQYSGTDVTRKMNRIYKDSTRGTISSGGSSTTVPLIDTGYFKMIKDGEKITSIFSLNPIPEDLNQLVKEVTDESGTKRTISTVNTWDAIGLATDASGNPKEVYTGFHITSLDQAKLISANVEDVKIVMADGTVAFDSNAGVPVAPKKVAGKPYDKSAIITWDALSTASSYTVKQSTSPDGPFTKVDSVITTENGKVKAIVSGLENEKTYYYVVTASNDSGEGVSTKSFSVTPSATVLIAPTLIMTSAEPASEVYSAVVPLSGSVDKASNLTIKHNGNLVKLDGKNTNLALAKNETFSYKLILTQGINDIEIEAIDEYDNKIMKNYKVTYTYKVDNINFYDIDGNLVTKLTPGANIIAKAAVENYVDKTKDSNLFVGLYDEQNNLVKFIYTAETLAYGESDELYAEIELPDDVSGYTLKTFVINNITNIHPTSDVVVLK